MISSSMGSLSRQLDRVKAATNHLLDRGTMVYLANRALLKSKGQKSNSYFSDRLNKLNTVSPVSTFEQWWPTGEIGLCLPDTVDKQFICVICLDPVQGTDEVHQIKCRHVFHRECLEKWYLHDNFDCPLCHQTYFPDGRRRRQQQNAEAQNYIWVM